MPLTQHQRLKSYLHAYLHGDPVPSRPDGMIIGGMPYVIDSLDCGCPYVRKSLKTAAELVDLIQAEIVRIGLTEPPGLALSASIDEAIGKIVLSNSKYRIEIFDPFEFWTWIKRFEFYEDEDTETLESMHQYFLWQCESGSDSVRHDGVVQI